LSIDWLRQKEFPGSEITIEETLEPGANYDRYLTSYRSEGLKIYALMTVRQHPSHELAAIVFSHGYIPPRHTARPSVMWLMSMPWRSGLRGLPPGLSRSRRTENSIGAYGTPDYVRCSTPWRLSNHPAVDEQRIGMWGHSMGGYITLRAMVVSPDQSRSDLGGGCGLAQI
jgi:hypothetical protein